MPAPVNDMSLVWNIHQKKALNQMLSCSFIGRRKKVRDELSDFLKQTEADELMVASYIYDHNERLKSYRLFAEMMGIPD